MTRGNERDEAAAPVEELHDAYAQALYRYAWSLLGGGTPGDPEDPVTEAVHEGLVAGVVLERKLRDPADRGPWLYALVRAACQRRGFAHTCPYTRLATVPAETPVARMFSRLPASHRELVELNLRHALPSSAVARVLGLEPRICDELSRSAIRRAAEGLNRLPGQDDSEDSEESATPNRRDQIQQVSSALALLRPPGAPPGLRERVVHTCLAPEAAEERKRIAAALQPLTEDGYPVHRARVTGVFAIEDEGEEVNETLVQAPPITPRPLPDDRITTRDQPLHENTRAPLPTPERRRWPLPAVSGLATVAVALGLWWWAGMAGAPPTTIDAGPAETGRGHDGSKVETVSTASENKPGVDPSPEVESTPSAPSPESTTGTAPESNGPEGPADPEDGQGPEDDPGRDPEPEPGHPEAPEDEDDTAPPAPPADDEAPEEEPEGEEPGGGSTGLLGGLFGLFFGEE